MDFLNATMSGVRTTLRGIGNLTSTEARQLLQRYEDYGLTAAPDARKNPDAFASLLQNQAIALAVCQILDDYRPIEAMVASLWEAAGENEKLAYASAALAHHCYSQGVGYGVLQEVLGINFSVSQMFESNQPLKLVENAMFDEYVVPLQGVIAERILAHVKVTSAELLFTAFVRMASALAPQVNRRTVMKRTPESRLAGRLFDADKVVRPMLGFQSERFYLAVKEDWSWNSRFWEQRALLVADSDVYAALRHARHAVATELHPHTLTTLGKILFKVMASDSRERRAAFDEGFERLSDAIRSEARGARITIHPYAALFSGVIRAFDYGVRLSEEQRRKMDTLLSDSRVSFTNDLSLSTQYEEIRSRMND